MLLIGQLTTVHAGFGHCSLRRVMKLAAIRVPAVGACYWQIIHTLKPFVARVTCIYQASNCCEVWQGAAHLWGLLLTSYLHIVQLEQEIEEILKKNGVISEALQDWSSKWVPVILDYAIRKKGYTGL